MDIAKKPISSSIEHMIDGNVKRQNLDQCRIAMQPRAFDEFLASLDGPRTTEELEGLKRLKETKYPWEPSDKP